MNQLKLSEVDISVRDINLLCINAFKNNNFYTAVKYSNYVINNIDKETNEYNRIEYYFNNAFINNFLKSNNSIKYYILLKNLKMNHIDKKILLYDTVLNKDITVEDLLLLTNFLIVEVYIKYDIILLVKKYFDNFILSKNIDILEKYYPKSRKIILDYYTKINDNNKFIDLCILKNDRIELLNKLNSITDLDQRNNFIKTILKKSNKENYDFSIINYFTVNDEIDLFFIIDYLIKFDDIFLLKNIIIKNFDLCNNLNKFLLCYYLLKFTTISDNNKYCHIAFNIYNELNDNDKEKIKNMYLYIKNIYNTTYFDIYDEQNLKYKEHLTKNNINYYNYKIHEYYKLKNIFENINDIENCDICYTDNHVLSLGCHSSHKVCIGCFEKLTKCPYCRDSII